MTDLNPRRLLHIDLAAGIPRIDRSPMYDRVAVIFWWRGSPLARRDFVAGELPLEASAVAATARVAIAPALHALLLPGASRSRRTDRQGNWDADRGIGPAPPLASVLHMQAPLARLDDCFAPPASGRLKHRLSLVICTRDRPEQLDRCLRSLVPARGYLDEILVVDNGVDNAKTRRVVETTPGALYLHEPKRGLSAARNAGVRRSSGDTIVFTDDDVVVHADWAARLMCSFDDPEVMCVTGQVLPLALDTPAEVAFEDILGGFSQGFEPKVFDRNYFESMKAQGVPVWRIGAGANMAIRRRAFDLVGFFDERLGAGAAGCSEDSEFWYRLLAAGWVCRYDPLAVVFHQHRREWQQLESQAYHYMRGHVAALLVQFQRHRDWGNLYRIAVVLPLHYVRVLIKLMIRGESLRDHLVWPRVRGCLAGLHAWRPRPAPENFRA